MTSPEPSAQHTPDAGPDAAGERVYRSTGAMVGGALMLAVVAWITVDALIRGEGRTPWLVLAGALFAVPLIVAFTFRPAVRADERRLFVRNPFRTIVLPWGSVADVRAGYSSEVFTHGGAKYQLWAVPVSLRQRKRAARRQMQRAADDPHGHTSATASVSDAEARLAPADQKIADLRAQAERLASAPGAQGEPQVRWAFEVMGPTVAGAVLLGVLLSV